MTPDGIITDSEANKKADLEILLPLSHLIGKASDSGKD